MATLSEVKVELNGVKNGSFVGIVARYMLTKNVLGTDYKINPNFIGHLVKVTHGTYIYGAKFENLKQNNDRQWDLFPKQEVRGKHYISECILENDTDASKHYLALTEVKINNVEYYLDNAIVDLRPYIEKANERYEMECLDKSVKKLPNDNLLIRVHHRETESKAITPITDNKFRTIDIENIISIN